mgnify:CR=1 FL=1
MITSSDFALAILAALVLILFVGMFAIDILGRWRIQGPYNRKGAFRSIAIKTILYSLLFALIGVLFYLVATGDDLSNASRLPIYQESK